MNSPHPYAALTPDCVLDALDSTGLTADGRLLALNSYENRVYQMGVEDAAPVVVKFYRPERWSDEAILEEHAFVAELAAREIPVVAALELHGTTLHAHAGFRFAVYPKHGGRMPEFDRDGHTAMDGALSRADSCRGRAGEFFPSPEARYCWLRRRTARFSFERQLAAAGSCCRPGPA